MRNWKRYAMAAVFVVVSSNPIAGCNIDIAGCVANIIADVAQGGNGCGSCGGCAGCGACDSCNCSCDDCDCGSCGDCACGRIENEVTHQYLGFNGAHPNARIPNSIQVRLTQTGLDFIDTEVINDHPSLIQSVLPPIDLSAAGITGQVYIEIRNFDLQGRTAGNCSPNPASGNMGNGADCIRVSLGAYARTCDMNGAFPCNTAETLTITQNLPVVGTITCHVNVDLGRGAHPTLPVRADVALPDETRGPRTGFAHPLVMDVQATNPMALEGDDVDVSCDNAGVINAALATYGCGIPFGCLGSCNQCNISEVVSATINELQNDLNGIIDYNVLKAVQFCQYAAIANDCPPGTTYDGTAHQCLIPSSTPGGCPNGTYAQGGFCWFLKPGETDANDANNRLRRYCMDMMLGAEGRVDIGSAIAGVTPGIEAVVDLLVAAWGDAQVPSQALGGYNVNIAGGVEGFVPLARIAAGLRSLPHNPCVPEETPPPLPNIPLFDGVRTNTYPNFAGDVQQPYDIGVGVAEEFIHYAVWKLWDSGVMCLHAGTTLDPALGISLLAPLLFRSSADRFLFPLSTSGGDLPAARAFLSLSLRPQKAPITSMDMLPDPSDASDQVFRVSIDFEDLELDFSIWTQDRYVRVGTVHTGLHIDLDLDLDDNAMGKTELKISLATIDFIGSEWTDAPLIAPGDRRPANGNVRSSIEQGLDTVGENAQGIASGLLPRLAFEDLVNGALKIPGSNGRPDVPLPFLVDIQQDALQVFSQVGACSGPPYDSGTRGVEDCMHPFAGAFIKLIPNPAYPAGIASTVETSVRVTRVSIPDDHTAFDRDTYGEGPLPSVEIAMSATGPEGAEFEYSYRTTFTGWSEWSRSPYAVIQDRSFGLQTQHTVFARARVAGVDTSMSRTSATDTFVVDVTAPIIEVAQAPNGHARLTAFDWISDAGSMQYRTRAPGGEWTEWQTVGTEVKDLGDLDPATEVEVRDAEGNVASNVSGLRGRPNPNSTGCGCATVGAKHQTSPLVAVGLIALLGLVVARRRRR